MKFDFNFRKGENPNCIIAHCPQLDVMTQGDDLEEAVRNIFEATYLFVLSSYERKNLKKFVNLDGESVGKISESELGKDDDAEDLVEEEQQEGLFDDPLESDLVRLGHRPIQLKHQVEGGKWRWSCHVQEAHTLDWYKTTGDTPSEAAGAALKEVGGE